MFLHAWIFGTIAAIAFFIACAVDIIRQLARWL
jgi:hypothetical protein